MCTVSLIVVASGGSDAGRVPAQPRIATEVIVASGSGAEALNTALERATGRYVLFLGAGARLTEGAIEAMVAEAGAGDAAAVYCRFRFEAPIGELPLDPCSGLASELGERQWGGSGEDEQGGQACKVLPLAAQLFRRDVIMAERFDPAAGEAFEFEYCLRLARRGVRWRRSEHVGVVLRLRPLTSAAGIERALRAHAAVGAPATVGAVGGGVTVADRPRRPAIDDALGRIGALVALQADPNARITASMPNPWQLTQWWYRLGFIGDPPANLLDDKSPSAPVKLAPLASWRPVDVFVATYKRPDRLGAMIESVRATGYPARVLVAAGDLESVRVCERFGEFVECVYSTAANRRTGCTAPLNHVARSLVRHDAIFCTDDCVFDADSIEVAMRSLYTRFPDGDGVVGLSQENIPGGYELAFPLLGERFLSRFTARGELFFPGYFHMYNDAELGIAIKCLGNWHFEPRAKLRHFHPCTGVAEDATHTRGRSFAQADSVLWHTRRLRGMVWGIDD